MNFLTLFELFLLTVAFYSIYKFPGASQYMVPLTCLFCIFWIEKLEKKMKEDEKAKKELLQYKLEKHHKNMEKEKAKATTSAR